MSKQYFYISQQCYKDEHIKDYTKARFKGSILYQEWRGSRNDFQAKLFRTEGQYEVFKYYSSECADN